jgi:hypothetical protein
MSQKFERDYEPILPLSGKQLGVSLVQERIRELDARGIELSREIARSVGAGYTVRYFSAATLIFTDL